MDDGFMPGLWDNFFVAKIQEGLDARSLSLSAEEERMLTTSLYEVSVESNDNVEELRALAQKAIGALGEAYARDMAAGDRRIFMQWDKYIRLSYANSMCMVGGIVQEWYLSVGRAQEKSAALRLSTPIFVIATIVIVVVVIAAKGCF
jgi:hypothetical protein